MKKKKNSLQGKSKPSKKKAAKKPRKKKPGINPYGSNHRKRGKKIPDDADPDDIRNWSFDPLDEQDEF